MNGPAHQICSFVRWGTHLSVPTGLLSGVLADRIVQLRGPSLRKEAMSSVVPEAVVSGA